MKITPRSLLTIGLIGLLLGISLPAQSTKSISAEQAKIDALRQDNASAASRGDFESQIDLLTELAQHYQSSGDQTGYMDTRIEQAEVYLSAGHYFRAITEFQQVIELEVKNGSNTRIAAVLNKLGNAYFTAGRYDDAENTLGQARDHAGKTGNPHLLAMIQNNRGNLLASQHKRNDARQAYIDAIEGAASAGDNLLEAKASINLARLEWVNKELESTRKLLEGAATALEKVENNQAKASSQISIGMLYQDIGVTRYRTPEDLLNALEMFKEAKNIANNINNKRLLSYSNGYLGKLYEENNQNDDALSYTQKAIFQAEQLEAPELLYLWQWQKGRIYAAQGQLDQAIAAYRLATYNLEKIRSDLVASYKGTGSVYQDVVGPVYLELADLLLQRAAATGEPSMKQADLRDARQGLEQTKIAELQDYFLDPCVTSAQAKATGLEEVSDDTAILYPVLLTNRTELLISLKSGIEQITIPVSRNKLTTEIRSFRKSLEDVNSRQYLLHAQTLYDWIIRPAGDYLSANHIATLVIIPGGPFRTIPFAAFHDGKQFLIEKYAVVYTPGLMLTDASPLTRTNLNILVGGLTESVSGYPALPAVTGEISSIRTTFGTDRETILVDKEFVLTKLENELTSNPYNVVHIASHGVFERDVRNSFILTYDDKLTMDKLEDYMQFRRFSEDSIELLTLSACQTAAGDDRAALGLAGIAIKAGARSALGTLWYISDLATSLLISEFYHELLDESISKAKALQTSQISILSDTRFKHPVFWAPYLLIGNWL